MAGRSISRDERAELRCLLDAIPVDAERHDERIRAFVAAWQRIHVPANVGRYAIHRLPFAARADLLDSLRVALEDPTLRIYPRLNCDCERCADLRGVAR